MGYKFCRIWLILVKRQSVGVDRRSKIIEGTLGPPALGLRCVDGPLETHPSQHGLLCRSWSL